MLAPLNWEGHNQRRQELVSPRSHRWSVAVQWLWATYFWSLKLAFFLLPAASHLIHSRHSSGFSTWASEDQVVLLGGRYLLLQWPSSDGGWAQLFFGYSQWPSLWWLLTWLPGSCTWARETQTHLRAEKPPLQRQGLRFQRHVETPGNHWMYDHWWLPCKSVVLNCLCPRGSGFAIVGSMAVTNRWVRIWGLLQAQWMSPCMMIPCIFTVTTS